MVGDIDGFITDSKIAHESKAPAEETALPDANEKYPAPGNDSGVARFSRRKAWDASTVTPHEAHEVINRIVSGWKGGGTILREREDRLVESFDDLPDTVKQTGREQGAEGEIEGIFHNGKTYLVRDTLKTEADVQRVLFDETYGHYGFRDYLITPTASLHHQIGHLVPVGRFVSPLSGPYNSLPSGFSQSKPSKQIIRGLNLRVSYTAEHPYIKCLQRTRISS